MMQLIRYPESTQWERWMQRPSSRNEQLEPVVKTILDDVKLRGDEALREYTTRLDGYTAGDFRVSEMEITGAAERLSDELKQAIAIAYRNIETFHRSQLVSEPIITTMPGVHCWRRSVPLECAGLYIPGGSAPLFSTVLMLGIPARLAGCRQIVLCTPCNSEGRIHPAILYAAGLCGITILFRLGGAQAIAAMAYGTGTVPAADKLFGPGNAYVTKAKELVQAQGVAIDMPAGPSELLIIADATCEPAFVAADLLSQAEHGEDSQVILLTTDEQVAAQVLQEINHQLRALPRRNIAEKALTQSRCLLLHDLETCLQFSNRYAPEHLILAVENPTDQALKVVHAGSVFLGNYSCESAGDYASGTNHTLPTNGYARSYSGVSVDSFVRKITFQQLDANGLRQLGPAIATLAETEQLEAHKRAVTIRLQSLGYE